MIKGPIWKDELTVNVKEIDEQHKKLFAIINQTIDIYENRSDDICEVMRDLVDYTIYHFSTELEYMAEHNYYNYIAHHKEHQDFTNKINDFISKLDEETVSKNKKALAKELIILFRDWYLNHILNADRKLGRFLADRV